MRIISKYKDYYDFYTGIFGIDNNKIYNRNIDVKFEDINTSAWDSEVATIKFAICGTQYTSYLFNGKLYHTPDELKQLNLDTLEKIGENFTPTSRGWWNWRKRRYDDIDYEYEYTKENGIPIDINVKKREPILITHGWKRKFDYDWGVPLLESFEFYKVLDAKDIYVKIETFLGWLVDNPPLPDTQTNIGKIEGHGFDKKTSFRPKMK